MGTKGDATRARVIATTAALMNAGGWRDLPVSAVLTATGLQKGGLYRHFDGRDALAHAALTH
ncbi:MAG: TetR/AcrR family transcriptional regulator, partial [Myxococcota bacterium]